MNECWQSGPVGPQVRPSVGDSGKAALGGRFADRERRYLVGCGQAAFSIRRLCGLTDRRELSPLLK